MQLPVGLVPIDPCGDARTWQALHGDIHALVPFSSSDPVCRLRRFQLGGDPPTITNIRVVKQEGEANYSDDDLIYVRPHTITLCYPPRLRLPTCRFYVCNTALFPRQCAAGAC